MMTKRRPILLLPTLGENYLPSRISVYPPERAQWKVDMNDLVGDISVGHGCPVQLLSLVAEALGLAPDAFSHFFEAGGNEDRAKIVKYPAPDDDSSDQGVGPHFDGGFLTLVSCERSIYTVHMLSRSSYY